MLDEDEIIRVEGVSKRFSCRGRGPFCPRRSLVACNDVSLALRKGETLGVAGESGCGKSTLAKMLLSMEAPSEGRILYRGMDLVGMSRGERRRNCKNIQMVFQDSLLSFHPRKRVVDIVTEPLMNLGLIGKRDKDLRALELLDMVELPADVLYRYPHSMSGGQIQRVGIARALSVEPEVLVCDESTSALDVSVQRNVAELLVRLQRERGTTMMFICHDVALINAIAHRLAIMYLGHIVEVTPTSMDIDKKVRHPYTKALLGSIFSVRMDFSRRIKAIESEAPSAADVPPGCPFQDRCDVVMDICKREKPTLLPLKGEADHLVACHLWGSEAAI